MTPASAERVRDLQLIAYSCDNKVDKISHPAGSLVKAGHRGQNCRSCFGKRRHIAKSDQADRRFPRHQDEGAAFLQMYVSRAMDQIGRST